MSNSSYQLLVESWVRDDWMARKFETTFKEKAVALNSGGTFKFDAVSADGQIVANISTSQAKTTSGRLGSGKTMKLRSDMLFLLLAPATSRYIILTEQCMFDWCQGQVLAGRVPADVKFDHAPLPAEMAEKLSLARAQASNEVRAR